MGFFTLPKEKVVNALKIRKKSIKEMVQEDMIKVIYRQIDRQIDRQIYTYTQVCVLYMNLCTSWYHLPKNCNRYTKIKRRKSKHNTKDDYQITGKRARDKERNKEKPQNNQKTIFKVTITTYLSIITLNVN